MAVSGSAQSTLNLPSGHRSCPGRFPRSLHAVSRGSDTSGPAREALYAYLAQRGYIPDGRGGMPRPATTLRWETGGLDDDLIMWLTKELAS